MSHISCKKEVYMKHKLDSEITLLTPKGKVCVPVHISYDDHESSKKEKSEIALVFEGTEYTGNGTDSLWTDTFASLQASLPRDVRLACCLTCRHGNMCPFGNGKNELFCTKDLSVTCKKDVCDLFDDSDSVMQRAVTYFGICDDFSPQSSDAYTYNDYLYQLKGIIE